MLSKYISEGLALEVMLAGPSRIDFAQQLPSAYHLRSQDASEATVFIEISDDTISNDVNPPIDKELRAELRLLIIGNDTTHSSDILKCCRVKSCTKYRFINKDLQDKRFRNIGNFLPQLLLL